jgi:hypothetical protein
LIWYAVAGLFRSRAALQTELTTVAKYMAKRRRPPSQGWRTFVHNHADAIASIDMFVVPIVLYWRSAGIRVWGR